MSRVSFVLSSDEAASLRLTLVALRELSGRRPNAIAFGSMWGTFVACAERKIGVSSPMNTVERSPERSRQLQVSDHPVMVNDWAEGLVDLESARSRRRHPSNHEPAWSKDGGSYSTEWEI